MATYVHTVKAGECPWNFVKNELGREDSTDIIRNLRNLATENGCDSIEDFRKKYFSGVGKTFSCSSLDSNRVANVTVEKFEIQEKSQFMFDSMKPLDSMFTGDSVNTQLLTTSNWKNIKKVQDEINGLASNKERVIEYHRQINESRENYVIVDKQKYTATVYSWDGKPIKKFEVGVAKNKSDALLRRSKTNKENNFESTTAGIYTISYRANGNDDYSKLYNDRVFTLSNDGLKAKGVGNGETGVALHQIPNGNTYRRYLLDLEGVSEENNRFSSGCVNFREEDFDELVKVIAGVGTKVYILPEDANNYITVKNGTLHFAQKEYTADVPTTTTKNDPVKKIRIDSKKDLGGESDVMMKSLADRKSELINDLGIDNDTYNELAMLALGIARQESEFGSWKAGKYHVKEHAQWLVNTWKGVKRLFGKKESYANSRGLTQIKLGCYKDADTVALMKKYGVTEDNLDDGDKAAVATIIALACIYKNELPALKKIMEEQNVSTSDALLYCWQGKKGQITGGTATPESNTYIMNVRKYMNDFDIMQAA